MSHTPPWELLTLCKKCGEELLFLDHEIRAGKCLTCMMIEFQESQEARP